MPPAAPAPAFATGRLILLGVYALGGAAIVTSFLRAPVLAVDEASLAVYRGLRAENVHAASPALVAVPPHYGDPVPRGSEVGWSPPDPR
ncbi:hypothetical protein ACWEVP_37835 [Amycolatopsis sp. NPDC003865]